MNNPVVSIRLASGIVMRGNDGEVLNEAPPLKDLDRNYSIKEYQQI